MSRARRLVASAAAAVLAVPLGLGIASAAPPDDDPVVPLAPPTGLARPDGAPARVAPALREATGIVTAFVELDAPSGLETAEAGGDAADVQAAIEEVAEIAEEVVPADAGPRARTAAETPAKVAVTANVVAGVVVTGDAQEIAELADDPAVAAVHLVVPRTIDNKGTDVFTRALEAWTSAGATGEGVTIGVIDTGVDYTHATFGGPGTPEAYAEAYGADGTGPVPDGLFDPTKFLGGYDFAGPTYDASGTTAAELVPQPDENPIDAPHTAGGGHGSHVAGTAAGFGVTADGETFRGDYATLTDVSDWRVGPGSAPKAGVYALKVFGDVGGSTGLVVQALDWAADPNGDGDFSDHLDIVNMSLGSDLSPADDPESLFVDELSRLGVLTVTSSGNGGDVTDVGGSPGNAASALTVANSVGLTQTYDAVEVVEAPDEALVGLHAAQNSVDYAGGTDVTAPVSFVGADVDGCVAADLAPHADEIAGTVLWLWWDDDDSTRRCGSAVRWNNAQAAGAVGVLIGSELPVFTAGIAGNAGIPGAQLTAAETDLLEPAIAAATAEDPVVVHIGPSLANSAFVETPAIADTLNSGSSRGVHGSLGVVKPDVAAPGTLISSAASGTGDDRVTYSGTSMSSPHVAGIAALVAQTHPTWTPQQIKAAVMNTATHDVFAGLNGTGPAYGPERVGSGRVDARDAVGASVIAYAKDDPELVSVTFGLVDVADRTVTLKRDVTVANTTRSPQKYRASFAQSTTAGGATITVSPAKVTVPPRGTAKVTVTLTVDPRTLARDMDPTQVDSYLGGVPRDFVTTISGRLVLAPEAGGPALRVPVQAAPRPVSALTSPPVKFAAGATTAPLVVQGRGVASGGWYSLMAPFALVATSPELPTGGAATPPTALRAADLRYVGFTSTAPEIAAAGGDPTQGVMALGIATYGEWATLGGVIVPVIDTDVDGDGIWDFETYVWKYADEMDLTTVETYALTFDPDAGYGFGPLVDIWTANGLTGLDTSVFDSDVLVVPMSLEALGVAPGHTPTFAMATYSPYEGVAGGFVDDVGPFTVDAYDPPVWFDADPAAVDNSLWYLGRPGSDVTVHLREGATDVDLLVLHTHNDGVKQARAQVVDVVTPPPPPTTAPSRTDAAAPTVMPRGLPVPVTALIRTDGPTPTGTITVREGSRVLATAPVVAAGRTGAALAVVTGLSNGNHELTVTYSGNAKVAPSSDTVRVRVTGPAKGLCWI